MAARWTAIALGGAVGALLRFFVSTWIQRRVGSEFPAGTLVVNMAGCFLIGLATGLIESRAWFTPDVRLFLLTGFLGSFTTYSTFALDSYTLAREGAGMSAVGNVLLHLGVGAVALLGGIALARLGA